jgi:membrane-bound lytic murein transglycosylase A
MIAANDPILLSFDDLEGWCNDDVAPALTAFHSTCDQLNPKHWRTFCDGLNTHKHPKVFIETQMLPVQFSTDQPTVFTGYFEPEIESATEPDDHFKHPIYAQPPEMVGNAPWLTREQIETGDVLKGRGLEIAWLSDPVEVFFLQVQGSGRLKLPTGDVLRVGFAAKNGHPYRSIGKEMIRRGLVTEAEMSAQTIAHWIRQNPRAGRQLMQHNPSYVFFRENAELEENDGPVGFMGRALTPERSIAVDPEHIPLGAFVWIEKESENPLNQLMVAQDVGSAIKGPNRADIFYGTGGAAGDISGRTRDGGRMVVLLPRTLALEVTGKVG